MRRLFALSTGLTALLAFAVMLMSAAPLRSTEALAYIALDSLNETYGPIYLWDARTGRHVRLGGHALYKGTVVAWSRDGQAAWWANEYGIELWSGRSVVQVAPVASLADVVEPTWSRDGRLAWVGSGNGSGQTIHVWDGATVRDLGVGRNPSWSADGRLAWVARGVVRLWDGSTTRDLDAQPSRLFRWSYDNRLAWDVGDATHYTIHIWDGDQTTILGPEPDYVEYAVWSPDGRLAWLSPLGVYIWDGTRVLIADSGAAGAAYPSWSSDGRLTWEAGGDIFVWDGGEVINVTHDIEQEISPAWSGDGRLAWTSFRNGAGNVSVWDGTTVTHVTQVRFPGADFFLSWSGGPPKEWTR